jgi:hypothetical protein
LWYSILSFCIFSKHLSQSQWIFFVLVIYNHSLPHRKQGILEFFYPKKTFNMKRSAILKRVQSLWKCMNCLMISTEDRFKDRFEDRFEDRFKDWFEDRIWRSNLKIESEDRIWRSNLKIESEDRI